MKKIVFLLLFAIGLTACRKEPISWDVEALAPLMHTTITLQQAIPQDLLIVGADNDLRLVYQGTLLEYKLDSVLSMPDTTITDIFQLPFGSITLQPGQTFLSDTNYSRYVLGGTKLTQLNIESGHIELSLTSSLQEVSILEYDLPTATLNGIPFHIIEQIPAGTKSAPATLTKSYDLSGYQVMMTGINDDDFNVIASAYKAYIDPNGAPVLISQGDKFVARNTMKSLAPNYARGSFGSALHHASEMGEPIDAFQQVQSGAISLASASATFYIENETGTDITVKINELTGINTHNNQSVTLQSDLSTGNINLNRATELQGPNSSPIPSIYTKSLDASNSNLHEFIGNLPDQMSYDFDIHLNPLGNISHSNDFIYNNTGIRIKLDAEIPLNFNANHLVLVDTSDFDIDPESQKETSKIKGGFLHIHTSNWYPFNLNTQFYMLDSNFMVIDSLFNAPQLLKGATPIFGVVDNPISSTLTATVTPSMITNLYQTAYIKSKIEVHTSDTGKIRILASYLLDINIVGDFTYLISLP